MSAYEHAIRRHFRRNFAVNVADLALWAMGSSCVSVATVLPLYIAHLTDSPVLIGLIPSVQFLGWRVPQLFTGNLVERLPRKLPFVLLVSLNERVPFIVLGLFILLWRSTDATLTLAVVFVLLCWQALGSGFVANAWQDMVAKVILPSHWGLFFGVGNAIGAAIGLGGAALSSYLLTNFAYPNSFAYSYLVGSAFFMASWVALSLTVEPAKPPTKPAIPLRAYLSKLPALLRADHNFRQFLLVRSFGTFSSMGNAFLAVYAVNRFQLGDEAAALFTATMLVSQAVLNPILGRLGDRRGHHSMVGASFWLQAVGMVAAALAPNVGLFLAAFALRAAVEAVGMTSGLPIVFQFCRDEDRPTYIGLANTLTSPPLVIAPLLGGALAGVTGYVSVFWASAILGVASALAWNRFVRDPRAAPSEESSPSMHPTLAAEGSHHDTGGAHHA
ncbi:MAG: MFS transporter [Anaerolineae bacterium]